MSNIMYFWFVVLVILVVAIIFLSAWINKPRYKHIEYQYRKKDCIMTESERECFYLLVETVGDKYYVFPQIHLPSILDNKIRNGQYWRGAFRHIDEKSVDFVLCDKSNLCPILAIELDDRSHERPDRMARDLEVNNLLQKANMPLLRLKSINLNPQELLLNINSCLQQ